MRGLAARGDHLGAARMLLRVARSAGRFPRHAAAVLTSAVIECQRAGLNGAAFEHAAALMRPEHRAQIPERHRRRIELVVRRPDKAAPAAASGVGGDGAAGLPAGDPPPALVPCCYCGLPGPETELQCGGCRGVAPFDVATGMRMALADWAECPACRFPCRAAAMRALLEAEGACPMCGARAAPGAVARAAAPAERLREALCGAPGDVVPWGGDSGGGGGL